MTRRPTVTLTFDRTILEHPRAMHIRRMRSAIWLYLALIGRRLSGEDRVDMDLVTIAESMGLSESTVRTWLGQLKKGRYVAILQRRNGSVRVRIKHLAVDRAEIRQDRSVSAESLERALGETGYREKLAAALAAHAPPVIQYALDRATDVPRSKIRRSRTALFLYLLNHEDTNQKNHSRH